MEKRLQMVIEPKAKERPRATIVGGHARIYTPHTTEGYEKEIRTAWIRQNGETPFDGPVVMRIRCGMPIPKSATKTNKVKMIAKELRPTVKPDIDNLAKAIMDALNGVAYKDDNLIVDLVVRKFYTEAPCIAVVVSEWELKEGDKE